MQPDTVPESVRVELGEVLSFYMHKLASVESRLLILCHRVQAAGIECKDLFDGYSLSDATDGDSSHLLRELAASSKDEGQAC
jgi:hypothetical protein